MATGRCDDLVPMLRMETHCPQRSASNRTTVSFYFVASTRLRLVWANTARL